MSEAVRSCEENNTIVPVFTPPPRKFFVTMCVLQVAFATALTGWGAAVIVAQVRS